MKIFILVVSIMFLGCGSEEISFKKMRNTYKVQLHSHTLFSDGKDSYIEMTGAYEKLGFLKVAITDHNYKREYKQKNIISGAFEHTTKDIHYNIIPLKGVGDFIQINHPQWGGTKNDFSMVKNYDAIEVYNGLLNQSYDAKITELLNKQKNSLLQPQTTHIL